MRPPPGAGRRGTIWSGRVSPFAAREPFVETPPDPDAREAEARGGVGADAETPGSGTADGASTDASSRASAGSASDEGAGHTAAAWGSSATDGGAGDPTAAPGTPDTSPAAAAEPAASESAVRRARNCARLIGAADTGPAPPTTSIDTVAAASVATGR